MSCKVIYGVERAVLILFNLLNVECMVGKLTAWW